MSNKQVLISKKEKIIGLHFFVVCVFAIVMGCGDDIVLDTLDSIDSSEVGIPQWERADNMDFVIDVSSIDPNTRSIYGYVSIDDSLFVSNNSGMKIYELDLQGNLIREVASRPTLSNRIAGGSKERNENAPTITDGMNCLAVSPDKETIYAAISWSPKNYSRPRYMNLILWNNGILIRGFSGYDKGNAYAHWENGRFSQEPFYYPALPTLEFSGMVLYLGNTFAFFDFITLGSVDSTGVYEWHWSIKDEHGGTLLDFGTRSGKPVGFIIIDRYIYFRLMRHSERGTSYGQDFEIYDLFSGEYIATIPDFDLVYRDDDSISGGSNPAFYSDKYKTLFMHDSVKNREHDYQTLFLVAFQMTD